MPPTAALRNLPGPMLAAASTPSSRSESATPALQTRLDALTRSGKKRFSVAPSILAAEVPASPRPGRRLSTQQPTPAAAANNMVTPVRGLSPAAASSPNGRESSQRRPVQEARPITSSPRRQWEAYECVLCGSRPGSWSVAQPSQPCRHGRWVTFYLSSHQHGKLDRWQPERRCWCHNPESCI